jgi:hypothetical protein
MCEAWIIILLHFSFNSKLRLIFTEAVLKYTRVRKEGRKEGKKVRRQDL